ncbi:TPA: hypothetical protein ACGOYL_000210 [Streptococcus suis]|nr:hypothetical protein [Streptococcus suis]NQK94205.1 hypothetical protein [Streptococcus suis]NQN52360.1 hypothetical protein [Streptococcus suis]NQN91846.1 hypothetical protein [Streptococcus suis]NQP58017.1 hypothetical protein [Streptococcus suis]
MAKENSLLKEDIEKRIHQARHVEASEEKKKKPLIYILLILLMTLAVVFSLVGQLLSIFK